MSDEEGGSDNEPGEEENAELETEDIEEAEEREEADEEAESDEEKGEGDAEAAEAEATEAEEPNTDEELSEEEEEKEERKKTSLSGDVESDKEIISRLQQSNDPATYDYVTDPEYEKIIYERAIQLQKNYKTYLPSQDIMKADNKEPETNVINIARKEFELNLLPFILVRYLPGGGAIHVKLMELKRLQSYTTLSTPLP